MAITNVRGRQLKDDDVFREDLNISVSGKAVITKVIPGTNIAISSTGVDAGTGDVTVNVTGVATITPGTVNVLPKYTSASGLGPSNISDSGTLITLGSNSVVSGSLTTGIISASAAGTVGLFTDTRSNIHTLAASFKIQNNADTSVSTLAHNLLDLDYAAQASGVTGQYVRFLTGGTERVGLGLVNDDFVITTAGTSRLTVTQAGNMGLNITPAAWNTSYRAIQVGGGGALWSATGTGGDIYLSSNVLFNTSSSYVRLNTGFASDYYQFNGQHVWRTAVSAAAGSPISFTTAMLLNANGNLGIGTTAPLSRIHARVAGTINTQTTILQLTDTSNGTSNGAAIDFSYSSGNILNARIGAVSVSGGGASLTFGTAASDGAAITNHVFITKLGNVLVGTDTDNGSRFRTVGGVVDFQGTSATDGGQLGSELLSSSNWTSVGWTGDFATGFTHTTGNTTTLTNTLAAAVGTLYQLSWIVTNRTAGSFTVSFGGYVSGSGTTSSAIGPRATSTANLVITPTADFNGTIVMSIRIINSGNASLVLRNSAGNIVNEIRAFNSTTNTSTGIIALHRVTTGVNISAYGNTSLTNVTSGPNNSGFGVGTLAGLTIGSGNLGLGVEGGRYINNGSVLTSPFNSIFIGNDTRASADGNTNEIVIGTSGRGNGSNTVTIGNSSITNNYFTGTINANKYVNTGVATFSTFTGDGQFQIYSSSTTGLIQTGRGSTNDYAFVNRSGNVVFRVPTDTTDINVLGAVSVNGRVFAWNTTTPGTAIGTIHLGNVSATTNAGAAITFSNRTTDTTAQAGIYINSDGSYGTRMYIATTNSFATGAQTALAILEQGNIEVTRGTLAVLSTTASTSTTTGALRSAGGLGVAGAAWFGGTVNTARISGNGVGVYSAFTANGQYQIYTTVADGLLMFGRGSSKDFTLGNSLGQSVFDVPTNTKNINAYGQYISTLANNTATGGGQIFLNGANGNRIDFNTSGIAAPSFTTRSVGTKIVLFPAISATNTDYAMGIESASMWFSVPENISGRFFRWYAGTTNIATLTGAGQLGIGVTSVVASARLQVDSTTQGVLLTPMTQAQRLAISSPANGLIVTQTDGTSPGLWLFISGTWRAIALI